MRSDAGREFSIIVPTLDEEAELTETLTRAQRVFGAETELIIVDGGSRDRTVEIGRGFGVVLEDTSNRGAQLDRGARASEGRTLVFLHADTWLEEGTAHAIREAVASGIGVGCLRFGVRPPARDLRYRMLERGVNWRTRRFKTATGDQAIFATRDVYREAGGYPPLPLLEDVRFVRAARRVSRFGVARATAHTSRRRWEDRGFLRTTLTHWSLRTAFMLGVDPHRLVRLYRRQR